MITCEGWGDVMRSPVRGVAIRDQLSCDDLSQW